MWQGAFFVHFLPAINSIPLPNSNRSSLDSPLPFSFSSFFVFYFFSSHLPHPTLFTRDPFNFFSIFGFTFFSISFSSFLVLLFFSSHLPCPTLFARDPILFSPTGNTILTRSEVQLTMEDRSSHFSRKIHRERLKKMSLFRKVYIWYNSKSMD